MSSLSASGCTLPFCGTRGIFFRILWLWREIRGRHQPVANPNLKMWWVGLNHIVVDGHEPDAWPPFLLRQFQYAWVHVRGIVSRKWLLCNASVSNSWNSFVKLSFLPTPVKYVYNGIGLAIYRSQSGFWKNGIVSFPFVTDREFILKHFLNLLPKRQRIKNMVFHSLMKELL